MTCCPKTGQKHLPRNICRAADVMATLSTGQFKRLWHFPQTLTHNVQPQLHKPLLTLMGLYDICYNEICLLICQTECALQWLQWFLIHKMIAKFGDQHVFFSLYRLLHVLYKGLCLLSNWRNAITIIYIIGSQ